VLSVGCSLFDTPELHVNWSIAVRLSSTFSVAALKRPHPSVYIPIPPPQTPNTLLYLSSLVPATNMATADLDFCGVDSEADTEPTTRSISIKGFNKDMQKAHEENGLVQFLSEIGTLSLDHKSCETIDVSLFLILQTAC
jgi:hypothetical protein